MAGAGGEALQQALNLHRAGRLAEAEALYRQAILSDPNDADALSLYGMLRLQAGDSVQARRLAEAAVQKRPREAVFVSRLGSACLAAGDEAAARQHFERTLTLDPARPEAHNNLGLLAKRAGDPVRAEQAFRAAAAADPGQPEPWSNLGALLQEAGRLSEAEETLQRALKANPQHAEALGNLGNTLRLMDREPEAESFLRKALEMRPGSPDIHNNLAVVLRSLGRVTEAEAMCRRALDLRPGFEEAQANLGAILLDQGRVKEVPLPRPSGSESVPTLLMQSGALLSLLYRDDLSARDVCEHYRAWGDALQQAVPAMPPRASARTGGRRLRLGIVSTDFRRHPGYFFTMPMLRGLDRSRFEVFAYNNLPHGDDYTPRVRRLIDHWRDIAALGDEEAARLIRDDGIDLLMFSSGHFRGGRLGIAALQPAPAQINYESYPATIGLSRIGWRLTDAWLDPPADSTSTYVERLVHVADGSRCFMPPEEAPTVSPPPCNANGYITFGSFNRLNKLSDAVLELWSRVLGAVPDSRLFLKAPQFADTAVRQRVMEAFRARAIDLARIELRPHTPDLAVHLADYGRLDIALDPFPYNGQTTSYEALWMGVPLIALAGDRYVARVGEALLHRAGLPDLIAADHDTYVALAAGLAGDRARLAALRASLRPRMAESSMTNVAKFGPAITAALAEIARQAGL